VIKPPTFSVFLLKTGGLVTSILDSILDPSTTSLLSVAASSA